MEKNESGPKVSTGKRSNLPQIPEKQKRIHPVIKYLLYFLLFFLFVVVGIPVLLESFGVRENAKKPDIINAPNQSLKGIEKKADIIKKPMEEKIGFKGLNLGMTGQEVLKLLETSKEWKLGYSRKEYLEALKKGEGSLLLDYEGKSGIGSEGPPGKEKIYAVRSGFLELSENKVVYISIDSYNIGGNEIDRHLKDWANFALKGLIQKYGNYSEKFISVDDVNIFSFKENYKVFLYKWNRGDNEIALFIGHSDFKYRCGIAFKDIKAAQKELQKSKTKSEL